MSDQARAWPVIRSVGFALIAGIVLGLVTAGLFSNQLVGSLALRTALLVGLGVAIALTVLLSFALDRLSRLVARMHRATAQSQQTLNSAGEQLGRRVRSMLDRRRRHGK